MTLFDKIEASKHTFTNTDLKIYAVMKKFPEEFARTPVNELAKMHGLSQASLTRFAKKCGFAGFNEFQYQYRLDLNQRTETGSAKTDAQVYGELLQSVEQSLDRKQIQRIAEHIHQADTVYTAGASLAAIPAWYVYQSGLILGNFKVCYLESGMGSGRWNGKDVYLLYSAYSGTANALPVKGFADLEDPPYRVLITFNNRHSLRKYFDEVVVLPALDMSHAHQSVVTEPMSFLFFNDVLLRKVKQLDER